MENHSKKRKLSASNGTAKHQKSSTSFRDDWEGASALSPQLIEEIAYEMDTATLVLFAASCSYIGSVCEKQIEFRRMLKMTNPLRLSDDQKEIISAVLEGNNVFFTGEAGTGKSLLLNILKHKLSLSKKVAVTAITGVAACNIDGFTLSYFSGIGGSSAKINLVKKIGRNKAAMQRWLNTDVLIIDEISMLDGELFQSLDTSARIIRRVPNRLFGGIQLILCGDFYQLRPVANDVNGKKEACKYCFESDAFKQLITEGKCFLLKQIYRQNNSNFMRVLREVRKGTVSAHTRADINRRIRSNDADAADDSYVRLFPLNRMVSDYNAQKLQNIPTEKHTFKAIDCFNSFNETDRNLLNSCPVKEFMEYKKGARVMLRRNLCFKLGLVNGACGTVIGFQGCNDVENTDDDTFDCCVTDELLLNKSHLFSNKSKGPYDYIREKHRGYRAGVPIVGFDNGLIISVFRSCWSFSRTGHYTSSFGETYRTENIVAQRNQIPLTLSWATSIHSSQGLTMDRLVLDLKRVFDSGQIYVALSRGTSLEGILIKTIAMNRLRPNSIVDRFYEEIFGC